MTLVLNGTTGVSSVDGSASTPAIQGNDANTGVFFPAADTVAIATNGTEAMRVDSSQNVGIGTSSPSTKLHVQGNTRSANSGNTVYTELQNDGVYATGTDLYLLAPSGKFLAMYAGNAERARIDSSGNLLVGTTSNYSARVSLSWDSSSQSGIVLRTSSATLSGNPMIFQDSGGTARGSISQTASAVAYNTSSDYRLKKDIAPMTGALAKIAALKPVTYKWNADDSEGEGFIAHELAEVVPQCVTGQKDAVETYTDEEGNEQTRPVYQGIDTSFLIATLTAALQEAHGLIKTLEQRVAALEQA